jgi:DNA mismatch repair protein MutS
MLRQYFAAKAEHPGVLLAMRVGDFYEFYGEDAEIAAKAIEITLTGRDDGGTRIPMAGVPYHSVEKYLARLIQKGHKVALCDQLEDPKAAKGLVKRGVTRVLTPGTVVEDSMLQAGQNNFLAALCVLDGRVGLATLDPSTGEFAVTEIGGEAVQDQLLQELARLRPAELLAGPDTDAFAEAARIVGSAVSSLDAPRADLARRRLMEQFGVASLASFGCHDKPSAVVAASMILAYAEKNGLPLGHVDALRTYSVDGFMRLDWPTRRSLELTQNMLDGSRKHTLLWVLDETRTAMGSRLIRRWIEQPLLDAAEIRARHDAAGRLASAALIRADLRDELSHIADIERLVSRSAAGVASPRDLSALRASLRALPRVAAPLARIAAGRLAELLGAISEHGELAETLSAALVEDPPHTVRDGGLVRPGFDTELDKLRELARGGKKYIADLERAERERTGIATLKVGFNSVFGYYLEVTKANLSKVPPDYIRKQTTANAERYITAELKEHESQVLGAEEKALALEAELFSRLRQRVAADAGSLLGTARALAELDVLTSFAEVSEARGYVRPEIVEEDGLEIVAGRHAVVEAAGTGFVPNDLCLGPPDSVSVARPPNASRCSDSETSEETLRPYRAQVELEQVSREPDRDVDDPPPAPSGWPRLIVLTGPNMSGKSTYLRQTALIVLMAQIGCFVPAKRCRMGLCERIFARIGARDELAMGQSTFMVEMVESANILHHATPTSLVILDEIGRGTSTYDGLAIAWAIAEHLAATGPKTLFATHYHQLNALASQVPSVANYRVSVEEFGDQIVWTHKVLPGGTDQSYGIHVAQMAGVPQGVLARAREVLGELERAGGAPQASVPEVRRLQLTLFEIEKPEVVLELEKVDLNALTPIQALALLDEWKRRYA